MICFKSCDREGSDIVMNFDDSKSREKITKKAECKVNRENASKVV